ncbi:MAG: alpha-L-rhamnosidase N-terminal domain-containing protein, partial [Bacteroidetes bacterium]|nr:alpha-L-rhamnosidase N-terminal domain-containing protein [Bacteroidota bacterium]
MSTRRSEVKVKIITEEMEIRIALSFNTPYHPYCRGAIVRHFVFFLFSISLTYSGTTMLEANNLRTEFHTNPLGIDNIHPRLSWIATSDRRGDHQSAYRIMVASSPGLLARDEPDLWDTGKVQGNQTSLIRYNGQPLTSHMECCWKVMAWDKEETPGPWSATAEWSMGILDPAEWRATWIGYDAPRKKEKRIPSVVAQWIWSAGDPAEDVPPGKRCFAHLLEIPSGKYLQSADLMVTADDRYRLFLNGNQVATSLPVVDSWQTPQLLDISSILSTGKNVFYIEAENEGRGPAGFILWLEIRYTDGTVQTLATNPSWPSSDKPASEWKTEGPTAGEARRSEFRGHFGVAPWRLLDESILVLPPARYLQGTFTLDKSIRRAVFYATALGICDLYVNGRRVSDDRFTPGWTDYLTRLYYRTYDVTDMLRDGANTWGGILADGWLS